MKTARELLTFIEKSPSMFHSVKTIKEKLDAAGFVYLPEASGWELGVDFYLLANGEIVGVAIVHIKFGLLRLVHCNILSLIHIS